jgi:hypothetical protein
VSTELERLLNDVFVARHDVARVRSSPGVDNLAAARRRLISALEGYTRALEASRLPVPYKIRDELRITRGCRLQR